MEEAVQMIGTAARTGVEIASELLKILAPALAKGGIKLLGTGGKLLGYGIDKAAAAYDNAKAEGTVSHANLMAEAEKQQTSMKVTEAAFSQSQTDEIVRLAEQYKIPVAVNGDGQTHTISYLESNGDTFQQIMHDMQEKRFAARDGVTQMISFAISKNEMSAIQQCFARQGVECFITQKPSGELRCAFNSADREKAELIMTEYKKMRTETDKIKVEPNIPETKRMTEIKSQITEAEHTLENSDVRANFYSVIANSEMKFPEYSEKNMELVHDQMPNATAVAGKEFWEKQGYELNKNAKGVEIVAPQIDKDGKPVIDENGKQTFTNVTVYDISETNAFEKSIETNISDMQNEYEAEKLKAFSESEDKTVTITDGDKSIEIPVTDDLRKSDVMKVLQDDLDYDNVRAELAANKFASDLGLSDQYFEPKIDETAVLDNIEKMQVNIRYPSDDISLQETGFSAVKLKSSENVRISVTNGDDQILIEPSELTDDELKTVFKEHLGMSELQAEKAVAKARKIDGQIQSRLHETVYHAEDKQQTLSIERTSPNSFTVKSGETLKVYDLTQTNLEDTISADFGIPKENAANIVSKAKKQSVIQNNINRSKNEKRKSEKLKNDPLNSREQNQKRVKR